MSTWTERIRTHAIWQQLEILGPLLDRAMARENLEPDVFEGLNRLKKFLSFLGKRLATVDSELIHPAPLDNINSNVVSIISYLESYLSDSNAAHISGANALADGALGHLSQVNSPLASDDLVGLRESADAYRTAVEVQLRSLQSPFKEMLSELAGLKTKLTELSSDMSAEKQRMSALASDHQAQFSTAQEKRSTDYLEAQKVRQEKFGALVDEYTQKLKDLEEGFGQQGDVLLQAHKAELTGLSAGYKEKSEAILKTIDDQRKQVEKLVGVIGNLGVTSGYQTTAKLARNTARFWQAVAVIALSGVIMVAYKAFLPLMQGTFTWEGFAGRVFLSLTVGVLAAYAISQADKYQQVERRSSKLALELEAIGPFLATMPIEKQEEFRLRMAERTFGTSEDLLEKQFKDSPKSVIDVALKAKDFKDIIVDIIKAGRGTIEK